MLSSLLGGAGLWAAGVLIGVISTNVIPKIVRAQAVRLRKDVRDKAQVILKDPEWRAIVNMVIAKVQKEMDSATGKEKLRQAVDWIKMLIPTNLDDPIIEAVVNSVVAELKTPFVI
jgi:hypothetical protein